MKILNRVAKIVLTFCFFLQICNSFATKEKNAKISIEDNYNQNDDNINSSLFLLNKTKSIIDQSGKNSTQTNNSEIKNLSNEINKSGQEKGNNQFIYEAKICISKCLIYKDKRTKEDIDQANKYLEEIKNEKDESLVTKELKIEAMNLIKELHDTCMPDYYISPKVVIEKKVRNSHDFTTNKSDSKIENKPDIKIENKPDIKIENKPDIKNSIFENQNSKILSDSIFKETREIRLLEPEINKFKTNKPDIKIENKPDIKIENKLDIKNSIFENQNSKILSDRIFREESKKNHPSRKRIYIKKLEEQLQESKKKLEESKKQSEESKKQSEESKKQLEESKKQLEESKKEIESLRKKLFSKNLNEKQSRIKLQKQQKLDKESSSRLAKLEKQFKYAKIQMGKKLSEINNQSSIFKNMIESFKNGSIKKDSNDLNQGSSSIYVFSCFDNLDEIDREKLPGNNEKNKNLKEKEILEDENTNSKFFNFLKDMNSSSSVQNSSSSVLK